MPRQPRDYEETNPLVQTEGIADGHGITLAKEAELEQIAAAFQQQAAAAALDAGMWRAFDFIEKLSKVGRLKAATHAIEHKSYIGLPFTDEQGVERRIRIVEEFCTHYLKRSKAAVYEDIQNLHVLGEELMEVADRVGLGNRELRVFRKLPADELAEAQAIAKTGDTGAMLELVEEQAIKHAKEKEALTHRAEEAEKDLDTSRKLGADKNQEIGDLKDQIHKLRNTTPPWPEIVDEAAIQTAVAGNAILQACDRLNELRDQILNGDLGDRDDEAMEGAIETMAVQYYDIMAQVWGRVGEVVAACDEVFLGHKICSGERAANAPSGDGDEAAIH